MLTWHWGWSVRFRRSSWIASRPIVRHRPVSVLGSFVQMLTGHDGFDAVILGRKEATYHLAFVHKVGHKAGRAPSEDNLLVFYLPDAAEWERAVARLEELGHKPVKAFNPYWDKNGKTFEDPDGYRSYSSMHAGRPNVRCPM